MIYASRLAESKEQKKILEILARDKNTIIKITSIVTAVKDSMRKPEGWCSFDVNRELDNQLKILHKQYKDRIKIIKYYTPLTKIKTYGNEISQVFLNLLSNAIDAISDHGEITISTNEMNNNFISVSIKDTGIGIPKDVIPNIFDYFYTTKDVGKGTGLGLAISHKIVESHNGRLFVEETKQSHGTTFTLELPKMGAA